MRTEYLTGARRAPQMQNKKLIGIKFLLTPIKALGYHLESRENSLPATATTSAIFPTPRGENVRSRPAALWACVACLLLHAISAAHAEAPIGELEVRGTVQLGQANADGALRISNTTYSWYSGDRIEVRTGTAILTLEEGHSFGFPVGSDASLNIEEDRILVELNAGMLLYAIEGKDVELQITSDDFLHIARPANELQPCFGLNATGLVHSATNLENRVFVQTGELEGGTQDRSIDYVVEPGEQVIFTPSEYSVVEVELPEAVKQELEDLEDGDQLPCIIWWIKEEQMRGLIAALTPGTAFWIGTATGVTTYYIFFDDEEECPICPPPFSP